MNCPQCGAGLLPNAQFCGACGFRIAQTQQPQANYQPQPPDSAQPGKQL